jgi:hypothetical protein
MCDMEPLSWCHDGTKTVYPIELQQVAKSNCSRSVKDGIRRFVL